MNFDLIIENGMIIDGSGLPEVVHDLPTDARPGKVLRGPLAARSSK